MRLWLLDADVVIKLLEIDVFDKLTSLHELHEALTLCTFDAAAIRTLPFLEVTDRAISAERLLSLSGLTLASAHKLDHRLSEAYFRSKLDEGKKDYIYSIGRNDE